LTKENESSILLGMAKSTLKRPGLQMAIFRAEVKATTGEAKTWGGKALESGADVVSRLLSPSRRVSSMEEAEYYVRLYGRNPTGFLSLVATPVVTGRSRDANVPFDAASITAVQARTNPDDVIALTLPGEDNHLWVRSEMLGSLLDASTQPLPQPRGRMVFLKADIRSGAWKDKVRDEGNAGVYRNTQGAKRRVRSNRRSVA
jgi:hypothetical protein